MKNEKSFQKSQLVYEFGILIQPLEELVRSSTPPSTEDYRIAVAKVQAGDATWRQQVRAFTTFAPDIVFKHEYQELSHVAERCLREVQSVINQTALQQDPNGLKQQFEQEVEKARASFFELVDLIPIDWEPVVFQANTPFTSYLRIKEALVGVKKRLHYFDRYLKPEFFPLFLQSIDRAVSIRLVTTAGSSNYGVAAVKAVSQLASQEFSDFRLIEIAPSNLHDRNLRVDNKIFTLGQGVDRAGMLLTNFGPSEDSDNAHDQFDQIIDGGRVVV